MAKKLRTGISKKVASVPRKQLGLSFLKEIKSLTKKLHEECNECEKGGKKYLVVPKNQLEIWK